MTCTTSVNTRSSNSFVCFWFCISKAFTGRWALFLLPFFSTLAIYAVCYFIGKFATGFNYKPQAIIRDLCLQIVLAYIMVGFFRRRWAFFALQALLLGLFFLSHVTKVAFHGVPVSPDDLFAIPDLFWVLKKWERVAMLSFGACVAALLVIGAKWRRMVCGGLVVILTGVWVPQQTANLAYLKLKDVYDHSVWDMRGNLVFHGATLHSIMEGLRYLSDSHHAPNASQVKNALLGMGNMDVTAVEVDTNDNLPGRMRNLHLILLESFWDASELTAAKFSRHPMDEAFLKLWQKTGYSKCMPPVYGGYTANSEFEALVGFPVGENSVLFERRLRNEIPALPRLLADRGYATVASHPNVAGFWNRTNAYRRLGFQTYWSMNHFDLDDMNREFLSDASLYRQVLAKIEPNLQAGKPIFNYVVTYTGHYDYPLNDKRPSIIRSKSNYPDVEAYANTIYYKSKELADMIATLRHRDPDAIIVAFGDHAPFLGPNHAGYEESGLLENEISDWTAKMLKTAYTTPLLIIDGRKGPVKAGTLPLYRLPALILSLLGIESKGMLDYTLQPPESSIRPLPGRQLVLDRNGNPMVFDTDKTAETPDALQQWMQQMVTLSDDLFFGEQYSLAITKKWLIPKHLITQRTHSHAYPN